MAKRITRKKVNRNTTKKKAVGSRKKNVTKKQKEEVTLNTLHELLLVTNYKLAMTRAQIAAISEIMIKNKDTTYEELWKKTNEHFEESKL